MGTVKVDRRTFAQMSAMALGAAMLPTIPAWAQSQAAKKRTVAIGYTGITWPNGPGRRGGGPPAPGAQVPAATQDPGVAPAGPAPTARRGGGAPQVANPVSSDAIFRDVAELGFSGLELFQWQINSLEQQGLLSGLVQQYRLPLVASYTGINLTDPSQRQASIAGAVDTGKIMKKYGGKVIVIGPSSRNVNGAGNAAYNFAEHKANIVATLNEVGKAITDIGLIAALHQHTGTAVETREETYQTMEAVDTRYVKFGPDIGQLQKGGVDPVEVVKHFLPVVHHMHFKDFDGDMSKSAGYCPLGKGKVDLVGVLDLMEGRKIDGMIMVELDGGGTPPYTPREAAQIAHDYFVTHGVTMKA